MSSHGAVSRRPPTSLDTLVARTHMYTYAANVWDLSIVQGPVSVAPRQTLPFRFRIAVGCEPAPLSLSLSLSLSLASGAGGLKARASNSRVETLSLRQQARVSSGLRPAALVTCWLSSTNERNWNLSSLAVCSESAS
jgi:hypothetical protein